MELVQNQLKNKRWYIYLYTNEISWNALHCGIQTILVLLNQEML